eukprot:7825313-Alexandrium_andersonii.AAC.1
MKGAKSSQPEDWHFSARRAWEAARSKRDGAEEVERAQAVLQQRPPFHKAYLACRAAAERLARSAERATAEASRLKRGAYREAVRGSVGNA